MLLGSLIGKGKEKFSIWQCVRTFMCLMHSFTMLKAMAALQLWQNAVASHWEGTFHRISMVTTETLFLCFQSSQLQLIVALGLIHGAVQFYLPLNCSTESKCNINTTRKIFYNLQTLSDHLQFGKHSSRIWKKYNIFKLFSYVSQIVPSFHLVAFERNQILVSLGFYQL